MIHSRRDSHPLFCWAEVDGQGTVIYVGEGRVAMNCILTGITILHKDHTDFDSEPEVSIGRRCEPQPPVRGRETEAVTEGGEAKA